MEIQPPLCLLIKDHVGTDRLFLKDRVGIICKKFACSYASLFICTGLYISFM